MNKHLEEISNHIEELLNIGIALSAEKDRNRLLERILTEARKITKCDAGTLYLYDKENKHLLFKIIHNETMNVFNGGNGERVDLPSVPLKYENVCAYTAITKKIVNIPDVYNSNEFDFSGPRKYDAMTGYKTISMLVIPLENHESDTIGVLQLINAKDNAGNIIAFENHYEKFISSLASQAAIALTNMQFVEEINTLFHSFIQVIAAGIDARTPYNLNHTRNVAELSEKMARYINTIKEGKLSKVYFDEERIEQLVMAAWLHDIGKVAVPLAVMDKETRLGDRINLLLTRLDLIIARINVLYLEDSIKDEGIYTKEWFDNEKKFIEEARELIIEVNSPKTFVDKDIQRKLKEIENHKILGISERLLTEEELNFLSIAKGTLTLSERKVMENHVVVTSKMLEKIRFTKKLEHVPEWAGKHHEFLDGTGYPNGYKNQEIPIEARILTIIDIYDALTATDRPYKKPLPNHIAFKILNAMVEEGKLDAELVKSFEESKVWEVK